MIDFSDLIGKPFCEDGYGPNGYSCYGLAVEVFRRYGIDIPRTNIAVCACKQASQKEINNHLEKYWEPVSSLETPTGLIIQSTHPEFADHIGVYIGNRRFIHVTQNRNVVIDRLSDWKSKIIGYYRYAGNTH
ncbi:C40 family peptidase [Desulfobacula phenolica]|uniref:NlpC/P60 family protein n=1 Tax=Desulfobacula phenolica TaxID=90732 RepID=A0A1H2H492_9BACT|nr:NlpC/P60 family protein [Desulfobacula phenolica]SDU26549.1 NlpC/P60 family protein [Desulfobacula phenolica]